MADTVTKPASLASQRPLSPHLGIYRWQISNTLSILHRMTGIALTIGTLLLAAWLWCAAYAPETHGMIREFFGSPFGLVMLFGWSVAFYYHLAAGIRHLFWDAGMGFNVPTMTRTGKLVIAFTVLATGGTWFYVLTKIGIL